jgi:hypothetical protein
MREREIDRERERERERERSISSSRNLTRPRIEELRKGGSKQQQQ